MKTLLQLRLQLIGRLGLGVALLAGLVMLPLAAWLGRRGAGAAGGYGELIVAYTLSEAELLPALLVAGLTLLVLTGIVVWVVTLYVTFRVAGPMYRFARNVELAAACRPDQMLPLRRGDSLQTEWRLLHDTAQRLAAHQAALDLATDELERCLHDAGGDPAALDAASRRLREMESRARL